MIALGYGDHRRLRPVAAAGPPGRRLRRRAARARPRPGQRRRRPHRRPREPAAGALQPGDHQRRAAATSGRGIIATALSATIAYVAVLICLHDRRPDGAAGRSPVQARSRNIVVLLRHRRPRPVPDAPARRGAERCSPVSARRSAASRRSSNWSRTPSTTAWSSPTRPDASPRQTAPRAEILGSADADHRGRRSSRRCSPARARSTPDGDSLELTIADARRQRVASCASRRRPSPTRTGTRSAASTCCRTSPRFARWSRACASTSARRLRRAPCARSTTRRSRPSRASIGESAAMRGVFSLIEKVAPTDSDGPDHRRERHRQGAGRARDPRPEPARASTSSSPSTAARFPRR